MNLKKPLASRSASNALSLTALGPDVVFFEIQNTSYPQEGDAFHVSPLENAPHLHSHTITSYDLQLTMPEALKVSMFNLFQFPGTVSSLEELQDSEYRIHSNKQNFQAIADGIDLSDLGYGENAAVENLFFQDAMNDSHFIDPVFIGDCHDLGDKFE